MSQNILFIMADTKGQFIKERVDEEINFGRIILFQMFDVSRAMSIRHPALYDLVDTLDILMTPYHDDKYTEGKSEVEARHRKNVKIVKEKELSKKQALEVDYIRSKELFGELMKLISRKGLLPKKVAEWHD